MVAVEQITISSFLPILLPQNVALGPHLPDGYVCMAIAHWSRRPSIASCGDPEESLCIGSNKPHAYIQLVTSVRGGRAESWWARGIGWRL
jgi:hypothetical protein